MSQHGQQLQGVIQLLLVQVVIEELDADTDGKQPTTSTGQVGLSAAALQQQILELVKGFVGSDVSADMPLAAQGLDSLAAMELRQKLQVRQQHERLDLC